MGQAVLFRPKTSSLQPPTSNRIQATDPFSRTELSLDMVRPNTELRARIRAYLMDR